MSLARFLSLLDRRALYFTRADRLAESDRFEGSIARLNAQELQGAVRGLGMDPATAQRLLESGADEGRGLAGHTFLNCWTAVPMETVPIWRMYVGDEDAVAVRSTFSRLTRSVKRQAGRIYVGQVRYIDYDSDPMPEGSSLWPWVHKRRSFEAEREIRALIQDVPGPSNDVSVPAHHPDPARWVKVSLDTLIDEVRVSPAGSDDMVDLVIRVLRRYRVRKPVRRSDLSGDTGR